MLSAGTVAANRIETTGVNEATKCAAAGMPAYLLCIVVLFCFRKLLDCTCFASGCTSTLA